MAVLSSKYFKGDHMTDTKTIIRRCVDYLHKYATLEQVLAVASILGVSTDERGTA